MAQNGIGVINEGQCVDWRLVCAANATADTAFETPPILTSEPAAIALTAGVIDIGAAAYGSTGGGAVRTNIDRGVITTPKWVSLMFFGVGADTTAATVQITGYQRFQASGSTAWWLGETLSQLTVTLGAQTFTLLGGTQSLGKTIAKVANTDGTVIDLYSPSGLAAYPKTIRFDPKGYRFIQVRFKIGTTTSMNAFWSVT